jgi:RHS repeat-associated protein
MPRVGTVRAPAALLLVLSVALGWGCPGAPPSPAPGAPDYQVPAFVAVPFGAVNALGGNLLVQRRDLDFDTRLGNVALGAVWNSADPGWRFGFEASYDGAAFVDPSGARHDVSGVPPGQAIPGTIWVRVDGRTLRTKGGQVHEFDAAGRLAAVRWTSGSYPRLEYRSASVAGTVRLVELRQWESAASSTRLASFAWDAAGRLASIEDRAGRRAEFTWDAAGRLAAARDPLDRERGWPGTRYAYAGTALGAITSSEGVRVEIEYAGARVSAVRAVGAGDPRTEFGYRGVAPGRYLTTVTDPLGARTELSWDGSRRLLSITDPAGARSAWTWSGLRPASFATPDGVVTRWSWAGDDPLQEIQPSGNVVSFSWHPAGEDRAQPARRALRRASDGLGLVQERAYDAQGRLVRVTNGAGESWSFSWSGENLLASATQPSGLETRYRDPGTHGHPRRLEHAGREEILDYDAVGNLLSGGGSGALPGAGAPGVVARSYDADRNLASLVLADLADMHVTETRTLVVERRSDGQPTRIARPFGGDSEFVYDALGRAVERRDRAAGSWRATRFERDLLGRVTEVERPNGMRTRTSYDAAGRRQALEHWRGGALESSARFGWAQGRLGSVVDAAHGGASETYAYDAAGRTAAIVYPGGERLELGYDARSRIVSERYVARSGAEFRRLHYAYDLADREIELRDGDAPLRARHLAQGRLVEERFGNGLVRSYGYDATDALLATATLRDASGAVLESTSLERGPGAGGLVWHAATASFGALPATTHEHFALAPLGTAAPAPRVGGFASDPAGEELLPYAYDALGNLTATGEAGAAEQRTFQYDAEHTRLLRVRRASGTPEHDYAYDEAGYAVARDGESIVWDAGGRPLALGTRASFSWDALGRLVTAALDGAAQRRLFGGRVRATPNGVPLAIDLGAVEVDLFGNHRYRHLDFRGNVKLVSNAQGAVTMHVRYAPYGADRVHGTADPAAGFAGGRPLGDLLLLGARLYDPAAGRFLAPDPLFQLVSQYAYAGGNPVWFWDPDGQSAELAVGITMGLAATAVVVGTITGNVPLVMFSASVMVGLVVPPSGTGIVAPMAIAGAFRAAGTLPGAQALFAGFSAGQAMQGAFNADFDGLWDPFGDRPKGPDFPHQDRKIDVRVGPPSALSIGPVATGGPSGGCSPAALATTPAPLARRYLLGLLPLQLVLAGLLWWRRKR